MPLDSTSVANKARNLMTWVKRGLAHLSEPDREKRIDAEASQLQKELRKLMKAFDLDAALEKLNIESQDRLDVCLKVFSNALARAWDDGDLSEAEAKSLNWAVRVLQIPDDLASEMKITWGKAWFERHLANAFEDGNVTSHEATQLNELAGRLGTTLQVLIRRYFSEESEAFLRGVFFSIIEDGRVTDLEWTRLISSIELLGISSSEFLSSVKPQAQLLVEHALADAKSDGQLSKQEDEVLLLLLNRFDLPWEFATYVQDQLWELRQLTLLKQGTMPSITDDLRVECRAGEIVHLQTRATYTLAKQRRGQVRLDEHKGWLVVTDYRFLFISELKNFQVNLRSVVRCQQVGGSSSSAIEILCGTSGSGWYEVAESPRIAFAILKAAIGRANQTIVQEAENVGTRYIPRDIRQRVWQRFGGRCAQCSANTYLEFDHIIPVAKGGGNSEANIQLLCRGCNLTKSDEI